VKRVRCEASGVLVPKDKAVKRFIVRNIVDASAVRDIQDASVLDGAFCALGGCQVWREGATVCQQSQRKLWGEARSRFSLDSLKALYFEPELPGAWNLIGMGHGKCGLPSEISRLGG
jgi:Ribosomal protein S26e